MNADHGQLGFGSVSREPNSVVRTIAGFVGERLLFNIAHTHTLAELRVPAGLYCKRRRAATGPPSGIEAKSTQIRKRRCERRGRDRVDDVPQAWALDVVPNRAGHPIKSATTKPAWLTRLETTCAMPRTAKQGQLQRLAPLASVTKGGTHVYSGSAEAATLGYTMGSPHP